MIEEGVVQVGPLRGQKSFNSPLIKKDKSTKVYARRFAPRADSSARYARSQGRTEQNAKNEADRVVHDFRFKRTTSKCQELHAPG